MAEIMELYVIGQHFSGQLQGSVLCTFYSKYNLCEKMFAIQYSMRKWLQVIHNNITIIGWQISKAVGPQLRIDLSLCNKYSMSMSMPPDWSCPIPPARWHRRLIYTSIVRHYGLNVLLLARIWMIDMNIFNC